MILYEFEGKQLIAQAGIAVPRSQLLNSSRDSLLLYPPIVLKAQVLSGKRAQNGGIVRVNDIKILAETIEKLFCSQIKNEDVDRILIEELIGYEGVEWYVSLSYDTNKRDAVLTVSSQGGSDVEKRSVKSWAISQISDDYPKTGLPEELIKKLVNLFFSNDCLLLEINPLVEIKDKWIALDAKIKLDDCAYGRHEWNFPPRSVPGYSPTEREIEAKKIDEGDYRGTAGSTYFDLDGDIAVLASGGGASLTAMDALLASGGRPANYTEYSGNPPKEKVERLTKIVLSKPNLNGLWVVGAVANFTDIYETLSGFLEALRKVRPKPDYPIVIRRGGPRDKEAFEMLKGVSEFDLHLFGQETSITQSAQIMANLAVKYAQNKRQYAIASQ